MPHPHAENMRLYAEDAAEIDTPWERWETWSGLVNKWIQLELNPGWFENTTYRRKPRTITYTVTVPEPLKEWQEGCWAVNSKGAYECQWDIGKAFSCWPTEAEARQAYDALFGPLKS